MKYSTYQVNSLEQALANISQAVGMQSVVDTTTTPSTIPTPVAIHAPVATIEDDGNQMSLIERAAARAKQMGEKVHNQVESADNDLAVSEPALVSG